ncbi:glycosyltransferase family 2 protein [Mangrovicoccus algicola]|uniref:Glycosyltransferase family 2 protein n=1 Tax=Mangrovicoccus algicola TaxID=2771008 RepID=A0A8J6YZG6_9RHOB|nr:glycosyltransferase family 2 protein [Mangrovicoccus algicola]
MPIASLVVSAQDAAATLGETLRSLLVQTESDLEVIVVDDGSQDRTAAVARSTGDRRVRLIQQPRRGRAGARNAGIAAARGEIIGFCDAGDLWRPGKLAAHLRHLDAAPRTGLSLSGTAVLGAETAARLPRAGRVRPPRLLSLDAALLRPAAMIRREALAAISWRPPGECLRDWWFDEAAGAFADTECWLRLLLATDWEAAMIPDCLALHRPVPAEDGLQASGWTRVRDSLHGLAPRHAARHDADARAWQLRHRAQAALAAGDARKARARLGESLAASPRPLLQDPAGTLTTIAASLAARTGTRPAS